MSRQVDSSNDAPGVEEGGATGCDELGCVPAGFEDDGWFDVEPDGDVPLEHPDVVTANATIPAIANRFNRTGHSFAPAAGTV
ncbi:hypothetical protein A5787_18730 [Mycobacterium sp. 852002-50816_SCH5313054-b]|nr:hypothetical protein A5787_18730 [Mycobacterium sp. 852002-50816_SCH5313054-b]